MGLLREKLMTTYFFPSCRLNVCDSGETTAYFCPLGRILERLPRPVEDRAIARWLGYGANTRRFRCEHDVLLHTIAVLQGLECSPFLWAVAHEDVVHARQFATDEEGFAALVHRWLNLDIWSEAIEPLLECGRDKGELRDFLRAVLEGEITAIETPLMVAA